METKFQTSFIPKAPLNDTPRQVTKKSMDFFVYISSIIFFISVLLLGGSYGYLLYLNSSQASIKSNLDKNIKSFDPKTIEEYVRLSSRMSIAKNLLSNHVAISNVFDYLQDVTLKSIRFTDFKYEIDTNGIPTLSMGGLARNYNSVAYQAKVFGEKRDLKDLLFSNLDRDDKNNVVFDLVSNVDSAFTYYGSTLEKRTQNIFSNTLDDSAPATAEGEGTVEDAGAINQ